MQPPRRPCGHRESSSRTRWSGWSGGVERPTDQVTPESAFMRASVHERSAPKWPGESCSCTPSAYVEEVEPKSPRLREQNREFSDPGANDACDAPHATTQIYCRRARASTTTPVPKDPYHSRKIETRRCGFRHQPSAGCTYSSSAVLQSTGLRCAPALP